MAVLFSVMGTGTAYAVGEGLTPFTLTLGELTDDEREIILKGCLINYNRNKAKQ